MATHLRRRSLPFRLAALLSLLLAGSLAAGCKGLPKLMRTPALYSSTSADLAQVTVDGRESPLVEVLYATDRVYDPERRGMDKYPAKRERFLRLGVASVRIGDEDMEWDQVLALSEAEPRKTNLRVSLESVTDMGGLEESRIFFDDPLGDAAGEGFAALVNERLESSRARRDIYVYVAPFKVKFDLAVITAAEFHHYMGRDGVFIAYSWPTKTGSLNYLNAVENAYWTRRHLRIFLEYLAEQTNAERIHLMSYSAGARVLAGALHQLRLEHSHLTESQVKDRFRIGQVVLAGPDIDALAFLSFYSDGMADLMENITLYATKRDRALGMSKFLYGWTRLGSLDVTDFKPRTIEFLMESGQTSFVSVRDAEKASHDNGHGYFRASPWVSTDIMLTLALGLPPAERGLYRDEGDPLWKFPEDYREVVAELVDDLAERRPPGRDPRASRN